MHAKVYSCSLIGIDAVPIEVEADVTQRGLPSFSIVGLPDKAVQEAKERVRTALSNNHLDLPPHRLTINLAPADIPKQGPAYDLPIAISLLLAANALEPLTGKNMFMGELSLNGAVRSVSGILPSVMEAKKLGMSAVYIPHANASEASIVKGITIFAIKNLTQLIAHFTRIKPLNPLPATNLTPLLTQATPEIDMEDVVGQEYAKRALEIAAAGNHNISLTGLPGAGKTMLAKALPGIMPKLNSTEALEITKLYSAAGLTNSQKSLIINRPFRSPHHSTSKIGLIGGGTFPRPGEISLAHRGVLFLDEFPEFPRSLIESLRQPLEDGQVSIARAAQTVTFPCRFLLITAANPCPCGFYLHPTIRCKCSGQQINNYQKKISGPMLDRIDMHLFISPVQIQKLTKQHQTESTKSIAQRVQKAFDMQSARFSQENIYTNAEMNTKNVKKYCPLNEENLNFLKNAAIKLKLSARSYYKTIKIARTIADLAHSPQITTPHLAESLQYRPKHFSVD